MPLLVIVKHVLLLFVLYVWHAHVEATHFSDAQQQQRPAVSTGIANELEYRKTKFAYFICILLIFFKCCTNICIIRAVCGIFIWRSKRETTRVLRIIGQRTACQGGDWYFYRDEGHFQLWCIFVGHCVIVWKFFFFWRDQFSCELTMLSQPFYVFNWFVIHIIVNNKLRIFFSCISCVPISVSNIYVWARPFFNSMRAGRMWWYPVSQPSRFFFFFIRGEMFQNFTYRSIKQKKKKRIIICFCLFSLFQSPNYFLLLVNNPNRIQQQKEVKLDFPYFWIAKNVFAKRTRSWRQ